MARAGEFGVTPATLPGGVVVLAVEGELDMATAPDLEHALVEAGFGQRVVIDLTECTLLDSSAVRVLAAAARESEGAAGSLALVVTDPGILRVLEISGVDTIVPVHPALERAL